MIVSLFLVVLGMRTLDLSHPKKTEVHHRAVVETHIKKAKMVIEDYGQFFDLSHHTNLIEPQLFQVSSFFCITCLSNSYFNVFPIASRAPPVFHA